MRIVIIGLGTIGRTVLKSLSGKDHHITIIDENKSKIEELIERYDVLGVVGNGACLDIQREAHVRDADLAVVNKPKGMTVHVGNGNERGTLVNALLFALDSLSGVGGVLRPGIVHRIDKDTTGLLVVAKNDKAHASLAKQIAEKLCCFYSISASNNNYVIFNFFCNLKRLITTQ